MTRVARLRFEAMQVARCRGHDMGRMTRVFVADGRKTWQSECRKCGAWVQVQPNPAPNGVDIGGEAVALECGDE